jgi:hypothetical protein
MSSINLSRISIGPVADRIFNGWPENIANIAPQAAPDNRHSFIPLSNKN